LGSANFENEILNYLSAILTVMHFGMELKPISVLRVVSHGSVRGVGGFGNADIAIRKTKNLVSVRHPDFLVAQMEEGVGFSDS